MQSTPLVSIVIPTYNQERYVHEAIESAIAQDYKNIEIIVSDDCSTDNTSYVIAEYASKNSNIVHLKNSKNYGRVKNYRKCLYEHVNGNYVLNLDGDDFLIDESYISKAVDLFEKNKDIVLVFSNIKTYIEPSDKYMSNNMNHGLPKLIDGNWLFINFYKNYSIPHLTSVHDVEYAKSIDFYKADICGADWESQLRLILNKKVGYIEEYSGVWRKHKYNASRNVSVKDIVKNTEYIDNPYKYAKKLKLFPDNELKIWRIKLLKRMFFNGMLKIIFLKPTNTRILLHEIKEYDTVFYWLFISDPRYIALRIMCLNKPFLRWVFKIFIKQESFIDDLSTVKKL